MNNLESNLFLVLFAVMLIIGLLIEFVIYKNIKYKFINEPNNRRILDRALILSLFAGLTFSISYRILVLIYKYINTEISFKLLVAFCVAIIIGMFFTLGSIILIKKLCKLLSRNYIFYDILVIYLTAALVGIFIPVADLILI